MVSCVLSDDPDEGGRGHRLKKKKHDFTPVSNFPFQNKIKFVLPKVSLFDFQVQGRHRAETFPSGSVEKKVKG